MKIQLKKQTIKNDRKIITEIIKNNKSEKNNRKIIGNIREKNRKQ